MLQVKLEQFLTIDAALIELENVNYWVGPVLWISRLWDIPSLFVAIAGFRFDLKTLGPVKVRLLKLLFHGFSAFLFL